MEVDIYKPKSLEKKYGIEKYFNPIDYINGEAQYKCAYCGWLVHIEYITIDHVIPLSRGGGNVKSNMLCACEKCNHSKADLLLSEWVKIIPKNRIREQVLELIEYFTEGDIVVKPAQWPLHKYANIYKTKVKKKSKEPVVKERKPDALIARMQNAYGTNFMTATQMNMRTAAIFDYDEHGNIVRRQHGITTYENFNGAK